MAVSAKPSAPANSAFFNVTKRPCAAKWYGKVATVMFYVSVSAIVAMDWVGLMKPNTFNIAAYIMLGLTGLMMAYAAFRYFQIFLSILRDGEPEEQPQITRRG